MAFRFMHIGHSPTCSAKWYLLAWARRSFWRRSSSTGMDGIITLRSLVPSHRPRTFTCFWRGRAARP